jgi:hypothetical protein
MTKEFKSILFIFLRAFAIVLLSTSSVYFICHKYFLAAVIVNVGISTLWTLNIKDLAISTWKERLSYIVGGTMGTVISLYFLGYYLK